MKIHRVVQMLGATTSTGKLADDMYDLGHKDYYSEAEDRYIPISHMDFQHMVRAFVKQNEETDNAMSRSMKLRNFLQEENEKLEMENQRLVQRLEHDETVVSKEAYQVMWDNCKELEKQVKHYKKLAEDNFISSVNDSEDKDTWKKKYEELRKTYAVLLEDYNTDTGRGIWKEKYEEEVKNAEYWKNLYYNSQPKGCGYVFSEIPNDTDGQEFVDTMKKYFNRKTYKMRVRGQHIKPELRGTGATEYGQSRDESTHLRVYIDAKQ